MRHADAFVLWRLLASGINPAFVVWCVAALWRRPDRRGDALAATIGLAISVAAVHFVRWLHPWAGHPLFPSGHEAFGASLATSLALWDRRLALPAFALAALLASALVICRYHGWVDVAASVALGSFLTFVCHVRLQSLPNCPTRSDD